MARQVGRVLFAATTDAATAEFKLRAADGPVAIVLYDEAGAGETIKIEVLIDADTPTWVDYTNYAGNAQTQTGAGGGIFYIDTPGVYRVNKEATVAAAGAVLYSGSQAGHVDLP